MGGCTSNNIPWRLLFAGAWLVDAAQSLVAVVNYQSAAESPEWKASLWDGRSSRIAPGS